MKDGIELMRILVPFGLTRIERFIQQEEGFENTNITHHEIKIVENGSGTGSYSVDIHLELNQKESPEKKDIDISQIRIEMIDYLNKLTDYKIN